MCRAMGFKRDAVAQISERRSRAVLRFDRKTHRYRSIRSDQAPLRNRIKEIAESCVRYGYLRIHVLLRRRLAGQCEAGAPPLSP